MIFFAITSWVGYTGLLLLVLWYGLREKRIALIVFSTIAMVITSLRQPLFFLGLSAPHPQNHFRPEEWELVVLANMVLITWAIILMISYHFSKGLAPLIARLFPSQDPNSNALQKPKTVFWVALAPFLVSVGGTVLLIIQFGGLSNFTYAAKISKELAGSYAVLAVGTLSCSLAMYGILTSINAQTSRKRRLPFVVYIYALMVLLVLATVFAWGNRYILALIMLSGLLSWHLHVRRIRFLNLVLFLLAAGAIMQGLKYVRLALVADALGRDLIQNGQEFWLDLSLSLHLVEFDALLLALRDAGSMFDFRWAQDFINGLLAWVPRSLYPEKETFHIGGWFRQVYEPWTVNGWPVTTPGSWYINFSIPGIFIGSIISGLIMRSFDQAFNRVKESPWQAAIAPFLGFFLFEAGIAMGFLQSWVLYAFPCYIVYFYLARKSNRRARKYHSRIQNPALK